MERYKYPRTKHLPWSPGASSDDLIADTVDTLRGKRIVVTEKMDGENTTLYQDHIHARSIDSRPHPSRDWVKRMHGSVAHLIPKGWRLCGENLYARHSIEYEGLPSYFLLFSVWNEANECLSWKETQEWAELLGVHLVPVMYEGVFDEDVVKNLVFDTSRVEGYVIRAAESFGFKDFPSHVAKWVRKNHVQTDEHWMNQEIVPNGLRSVGDES